MPGPFDELFASHEAKYGLNRGFLSRMAQIESSMNPNAQNPKSSAGGLFQFINSTAKNYGLQNKFDPVASTDAASRLAIDNKNILAKALGREPTSGELYLAHQQGAAGASKLLSNPSAPAASIVGEKAAALNGGAGLTAGDLANKWISKFDSPGGIMSNPAGNFGLSGPKGMDSPALPTAGALSMQPAGMTPTAAPEAAKGLMDNKDFTGGLEGIAKAFGAGKPAQQQQQSSMPGISNYSAEQAARAQSAQALMAQLMQRKMMPRGVMG